MSSVELLTTLGLNILNSYQSDLITNSTEKVREHLSRSVLLVQVLGHYAFPNEM